MQTTTGKFYPKLVLEKINEAIVKCFFINPGDRLIINEISSELQELAFSLWDMEDKEGNTIIPIYKIE
jgi:hypothetical protein